MILTERDDGAYRIYAGAMEGTRGDGFIAAAVVVYTPCAPSRSAREAFRNEALACGHRWQTPESALAYALAKGQEAADRARDIDRKLFFRKPPEQLCVDSAGVVSAEACRVRLPCKPSEEIAPSRTGGA